ncbi:MAG: Eco57I restriction-modification methylase domain-containing protein [Egibacteraceae bacterium]
MDVIGLLTHLEVLPTVRRLPPKAPLDAVVLVAGIEVARTAARDERMLRRVWQQRHGGGATPLLLVDDDPRRSGCLSVLGPVDPAGPLRSMEAGALRGLLTRVSTMPRLAAVREVAAELDRLDQSAIPGLKLHGLLTVYVLDDRLRHDTTRWAGLEAAAASVPAAADWQQALIALGYDLQRRSDRGFLVRHGGAPVAVVHPKADPAEFARLDPDGRPPEGLLLNDVRADGASFGLLASGARLRLFDADSSYGSATARYLDLDATALRPEDRPFLGLLGPAYLAESGFRRLEEDARAFGTRLWRRLDDRIRQTVLPTLGRALGRWAEAEGMDLADDAVREELRKATLTLVFRALFILYAEGARYLPVDHPSYRNASLSALAREAADTEGRLDPHSTSLWDRFTTLVKAMRTGNRAWGVPAYNGALFSRDGFEGAELADPDFGRVLVGLGRDPESGSGVDYSTLEIGHLGHIYEGLLSLQLSVADTPLRYDASADRYVAPAGDEAADVGTGDLLWQTHRGGRKTGGVYYTRSELVRHLVRQTVVRAFREHLERVRATALRDPAAAAEQLFDFAVLDPACGSAHFLVHVTNELADLVVSFLAETPLPEVRAALSRLATGAAPGVWIEDAALLRRLVLKRCVFGVDLSPMGAEIAKLSLWLTAFVPGLSLVYLDRNIQVGNSLVGVADPSSMRPGRDLNQRWMWEDKLHEALRTAAKAVARVAAGDDRTPEEIRSSAEADVEARAATASLERLFHLWTAEPFGLAGARQEVELRGAEIVAGATNALTDQAGQLDLLHHFLHWLPAFPQVFDRPRPGFDAVIGNPPWDEVTVEAQSFYALYRPGIRRGISETEREAAVEQLIAERPELPLKLVAEQERAAQQRAHLAVAEYPSMSGDPDLSKYFCHRYRSVLREGGVLGVVLPRTAFVNKGSQKFRGWLFEQTTCERIDFLINRRRWAFDTHPQYTVALVAARRAVPSEGHRVWVAGAAISLDRWLEQARSPGLALARQAFGPGWTPPLLRNQAEADLLAKCRQGSRFPHGAGGRWQCFSVRELDETNDRDLWRGATKGWPLWKGESFDQYEPHGDAARICPVDERVLAKVRKPRPGTGSLLASELPTAVRRQAVRDAIGHARVTFHDVTQKDNSRTVVACLVPPETLLTNSAPYLAFVGADDGAQSVCLGLMNSLPFDWQARRFAEVHLSFFILEGLVVPDLSDEDYAQIAEAAARLSCVDERFADFAASVGVAVGPLDDEERERLRVEIDARVARAWALTSVDLEVMYADFTLNAVPARYRMRLIRRLTELS